MDRSDDEHARLLQEIRGLRKAVESSPGDIELRLRLVHHLLEADQPQGAWHNCIYILNERPNHVEALGLAKKAAETVGAHERAEEYVARLAELMSTSPAKSRQGGPVLRLIRGGREDTDEFPAARARSGC